MVNREAHTPTIEWLREHWTDIMELIPADVADSSPFNDPKVATKSRHSAGYESEEGTVDTYGTVLSSLYYGTENDDNISEKSEDDTRARSPHTRPVSYAQVTRDGNISTVSQVSGWTDPKSEEFSKLQEQHSHLEAKFESVTAELGELKTLLQQLLAQSKPQQESEPPSKKQATFETPKRAERGDIRNWLQSNDMDLEYGLDETNPEAGKSS